jgi:hypothetical protein
MEDNRKKWIQPQLIVLGRGTPEENVLAGCKTSLLTGLNGGRVKCKKKANCSGNICSSNTAAS